VKKLDTKNTVFEDQSNLKLLDKILEKTEGSVPIYVLRDQELEIQEETANIQASDLEGTKTELEQKHSISE
jgi:hypothetical protein